MFWIAVLATIIGSGALYFRFVDFQTGMLAGAGAFIAALWIIALLPCEHTIPRFFVAYAAVLAAIYVVLAIVF